MTSKMTLETLVRRSVLIGVCCLAAGCVTINIYFPAAAAEKAADRIIDEVWQLKSGASPQGKSPEAAPGESR